MSYQKNSHEFALFVSELRATGKEVIVQDPDTVHRMTHVLRLTVGDSVTLFSATQVLRVLVNSMTKKAVSCQIEQVITPTRLVPRITLLLPVLKKEALEEAIYSAVELGVTELALVKTEKTHAAAFLQAHHDRLLKIIHAAQEQAKQFVPITLTGPVTLIEAVATHTKIPTKIVALQGGGTLLSCLKAHPKDADILLAVGPEADFTDQEKIFLQENNFIPVSLGSTVLRAQQAVTVLVGAVRAFTV